MDVVILLKQFLCWKTDSKSKLFYTLLTFVIANSAHVVSWLYPYRFVVLDILSISDENGSRKIKCFEELMKSSSS